MTPEPPPPPHSRSVTATGWIRNHRSDIAALIFVLIAAALVRFARIDAVEFFHDEAMVSMMAQEMAHGETFPLVGIISSVGIPNPPASIYVMAVPFAFTSDPVIATAYVALLNVIGVGLLWGIARKEFGFTAALVAGLVFALNPWAILYSRKIWAQDFVNPFLLLTLTAALWGFKDGKRWGQILALPLMLFAMQIHFAAWALVPLFAWIGFTGRKNIRWRAVLLSIVLGVLVMLPYAIGLAQTLQSDPTRIADSLGRPGITYTPPFVAMWYAIELSTGVDVSLWVIGNGYLENAASEMSYVFVYFVLFLMAVGLLSLILRRSRWAVGFLLWIALPVVAFQIGLADIWRHYFVPQLTAFALLIGIGLSGLLSNASAKRGLWVTLASMASILLVMAFGYRDLGFLIVMDNAYTHGVQIGEGTSGYTTPMFVLGQVRDAIPDDINDVIVLTDGDRVWFDVEAARWPVMLRDQAACVRALPSDGFFVQPAHPFTVITTPTASRFIGAWYPDVSSAAVIPAREGEGEYRVDVYDSAPPAPFSDTNSPSTSGIVLTGFANGAFLTRWAIDGGRVTLMFTLPDAPDRTFYGALDYDYQYFIHLLDADGNRIGQRDASFWPGRHWCAGDTLSMWTDIPGASDADTLRFGFYKLLDPETATTQAVDILDVAGNPAGNWLDIPLK